MMGAGISCFLAFAAGVSLGVHLNPGVEWCKSFRFGVDRGIIYLTHANNPCILILL